MTPKKYKPFFSRLNEALRTWEIYSRPMRKRTQRLWRHYENGWYDYEDYGSRNTVPLNLIDRGVQVIAPFLVSQNPGIMIQPRQGLNNPNVRSFARTLELAVAHLFDEIKFAEYTLRPVVMDALFGMGITKTGITPSVKNKVEIFGHLHDIGQPYCDRVDFNDYIGDVSARNRQEVKLEGNWFRLPLQYVRESGLFKNFDGLKPDLKMYGDDTSPEKVAKRQEYNEIWKTVRMADIWLPQDGVIVTLPPEGQGDKFLREVEWDGPETGPYDVLAFRYFPDSIIPIPPVWTWLDYNKTINVVVNKMREQVEREKTIAIGLKGSDEDLTTVRDARHGEMVGVESPDVVKEVTFGGFVDKSFPFLMFMLNQFSATGPNLNVTGGKEVMAQTLGQEQMLQMNAMREVDDMQNKVYSFTREVARKLIWFLWNDPFIVIPVVKRIAGFDIKAEYSEASKEGDFTDFTFDIEPYSMAKMNPEIRFQRLLQFVMGIVLPTAQLAAGQGTILNVPALMKELARYLQISNLDDWYQSGMPSSAQMNPYQMMGQPAGKQADQRFGGEPEGAMTASNQNNLLAQQTRGFGAVRAGQAS